MGDFIIITLMVSSFWLLWEIIRVVSMEWLNRDEITLPGGRAWEKRAAALCRFFRTAFRDVSGHGYQKGGTFRAGYG